MKWIELTSETQLNFIKESSHNKPVIIFKHSTRCGTSAMMLTRFERNWEGTILADTYFLNLIAHKTISNTIAEDYHVYHESPQILLISKGECIYDESHLGISASEIKEQIIS